MGERESSPAGAQGTLHIVALVVGVPRIGLARGGGGPEGTERNKSISFKRDNS